MKILFTGGGSGGHVFPILALSREIRRISDPKKIEFFYLGPRDEFGEILLSQEDIKVKTISTGKWRRYFNFKSFFKNLRDLLFRVPVGIFQSLSYIFALAPDLIFSKGGFGSIPGVIAGWLLGVPIFLHESDAVPGMANRILAKFSLEIFVSFPRTIYFPVGKILLVGNLIRQEILEGSKEEAKESFKLAGKKPLILILGGSQGAERINDKVLEALPEFLKNFEVIHQCGEKNFDEVRDESKVMMTKDLEKYYHPFPFLKEEQIKKAYAACDLIISRGGAGAIFEIAALGKPSILIPLPESAQKHQLKNAYTYSLNGAAIVLEEDNFTPRFFVQRLNYLFSNSAELEKMRQAAREFSRPRAAHIVAEYIVEYLFPSKK